MRACTIEYLAPAVFDDLIEVYVRMARIGRTSVTYELAAYRARDDELMVTATQTLVLVDLDERKAASPTKRPFAPSRARHSRRERRRRGAREDRTDPRPRR